MDEVATQHRNVLTVTAGGPPRGSKGALLCRWRQFLTLNKMMTGKGRRAKEMEPKEDRDRKRIKVDEDSSVKTVKTSIKKPKVHKGRAQLKVIGTSIYQVLNNSFLTNYTTQPLKKSLLPSSLNGIFFNQSKYERPRR